jgi:hypothetical protein
MREKSSSRSVPGRWGWQSIRLARPKEEAGLKNE